MARSYNGEAQFSSNFNVEFTAPLDNRLVVDSVEDLTSAMGNFAYVGMVVSVKGSDSLYILTALPAATATNWKQIKGAASVDSSLTDLQTKLNALETKHTTELGQAKTDLLAAIAAAKAEILGEDFSESYDTLKEIGDWIEEHQDLYEALVSTTASNLATAKSELEGKITAATTDLEGKITAANTKHETELAAAKSELEGKITAANTKHTNELTAAKNELQGNIDTLEEKHDQDIEELNELISGNQSSVDEKIAEIEQSITDNVEELDGKITAANTKHTTELAAAKSELDGKITAVNNTHTTELAAAKSELEGKITAANTKHETELAAAKTELQGNITSAVNQAKADILGDDDLDEKLDTIKEIADWIDEHQGVYESLVENTTKNLADAKTELEGKINTEKTNRENADKALDDKITALSDKVDGDVDVAISELEGKIEAEKTAREQADTTINTSITNLTKQHNDDKAQLDQDILDAQIYVSEAGDDWLTEKVGGIPQGLKKDNTQLTNKTYSQILDMILYPTLQPTVSNPSTTLTYADNNSDKQIIVVAVGTTLPAESAFTRTANRGTVTYTNADGNKYYAGAATQSPLTMTDNAFGTAAAEKKYTVTDTTTFANGPKLLDNKGGDSTVASYKSGSFTKYKYFDAVYPIWANSTNIDAVAKLSTLYDYVNADATLTLKFPAETLNKFEIHVPTSTTVDLNINQYNPNSGKYDIPTPFVAKSGTPTTTHDGMTYNVYVRSNDPDSYKGSADLQIIIKKKP